MTFRPSRTPLRATVAAASVMALLVGSTTASAAAPTVTSHLSTYATPSTVRAGTAFTVTGAVSPKGGTVVLERLVGKAWKPLGKAKATSGQYTFIVRSPHKPASWALKVVRGKTGNAATTTGKTVHVLSTSAYYVVTATATTAVQGRPTVITGAVHPKATGLVLLQIFRHGGWAKNGYAHLSGGSAFVFNTVLVAGDYSFRVVKAFSAKVAAGTSAVVTSTVTSPTAPAQPVTTAPPAAPVQHAPTGPSVTTTQLPGAVTTEPFSTTLAASGGVHPYTWSYSGVPAWLSTTTSGGISGTPTTPGTTSLTVTVKDAAGLTGTATLALTVLHISGVGIAWGSNFDGTLGDGSTTTRTSPVLMLGPNGFPPFTSVVTLAAGGVNVYALRSDGTVWAAGADGSGQLGNGTYDIGATTTPVQVTGLTGVTAVASSYNTAFALKSDGTLWSWGDNGHGLLGTGADVGSSNTPVQVQTPAAMKAVKAIAVGATVAYALDTDGVVWAWGDNNVGQLGNGTLFSSLTPTKVSGSAGMVAIAAGQNTGYELSASGNVYAWGSNGSHELHYGNTINGTSPQLVAGVSGVQQLSAGAEMAYGLTSNGTVVAWGDNDAGEMGVGSNDNETGPVTVDLPAGVTVASLSAGIAVGYVLTTAGTVYTWGGSAKGALGNGAATLEEAPTLIADFSSVSVLESGPNADSAYAVIYTTP